MSVKAFVDHGFSDPLTFCIHLLQSPEFKLETLKKFGRFKADKEGLAVEVAELITGRRRDSTEHLLDPNKVLLEYAKQSRQWFTYKIGKYSDIPVLDDASDLFTEFGSEKWYGPIVDAEDDSCFYIRIYSFDNFAHEGKGETRKVKMSKIRWPILANVNKSYISLYWNGFTTNTEEKIMARNQFPFWLYVPKAFKELEDILGGTYRYPVFHKLVLKTIWDRYIADPDYTWRHLAVRAEASGVALNARSAGITEIDVRGLLALANQLAESVADEIARLKGKKLRSKATKTLLSPKHLNSNIVKSIENVILRTLIHEWGTKSYEFSLESDEEKLFRAHCYFGLKPKSYTQDRFPHFKAYQRFGGTFQAIDFLLSEER